MTDSLRGVLLASFIGVCGVVYTAQLSYWSNEHQVEAQVNQIRATHSQALATQLREKSKDFLLAMETATYYASISDTFSLAEQKRLDAAVQRAAVALQPYAPPELAFEAFKAAKEFPKRYELIDGQFQQPVDLSLEITRLQVRFSELLTLELLALNESAIPGYEKSRENYENKRETVLALIDKEIARRKSVSASND